jgi:hypothetical protein
MSLLQRIDVWHEGEQALSQRVPPCNDTQLELQLLLAHLLVGVPICQLV